jgi:hypothetical protein
MPLVTDKELIKQWEKLEDLPEEDRQALKGPRRGPPHGAPDQPPAANGLNGVSSPVGKWQDHQKHIGNVVGLLYRAVKVSHMKCVGRVIKRNANHKNVALA